MRSFSRPFCFIVAHPDQNPNYRAILESFDNEHWLQIYEDFKNLYKLKELIDPLEEQRLKEQQEQKDCEQKGK